MKRHTILWIFALFSGAALANAQNLILNPGFEDGGIPTTDGQISLATGWNNDCGRVSPFNNIPGSPDLFDRRSPYCHTQIPANKWGNRDTQSGGNRYVGFTGGTTPGFYSETVKGTLGTPLTAGCNYHVSFWVSAIDGFKGGPAGAIPCTTPLETKTPDPDQRIEVVLRKGNDCSIGKVVFQSPLVTQKTWTYFDGQFSLTAAEAAAGYDRIEFRLSIVTPSFGRLSHAVYLDDVSLVGSGPPIDPDFQLTGSIPAGNNSTFLLQATVGDIPPGSAFWWNVEEIDPLTEAVVPNTTMTNPPAWWSTPKSTTFPGYYNNNSPNGVFVQGHTYRIRRGTWSQCSPWSEVSKTVSMYSGRRICASCPPVALRAANGQWWVAENGGGNVINANRDVIGPWEAFRLVDLGGGNVALQCMNGQYVVAEGSGGRELFCNRYAIGSWETFKKIDLGGGNIALQCANGQYVVAEGSGGGEVRCDRNAIGSWETFLLSFQ